MASILAASSMIADDNMIKRHSSKGDMENGKRPRKKSWDCSKVYSGRRSYDVRWFYFPLSTNCSCFSNPTESRFVSLPNNRSKGLPHNFVAPQPSTPQGRFIEKLEGLPRKGVEATVFWPEQNLPLFLKSFLTASCLVTTFWFSPGLPHFLFHQLHLIFLDIST